MQGAIENKGKRWWLLRKASRIGDVACLYWHTVSGSCRVYCSMSLMHLITGASHPDRPLPPVHVTRARTARDAMKLISCRRVSVLYYVVAQHLRYQDPIPWSSKPLDNNMGEWDRWSLPDATPSLQTNFPSKILQAREQFCEQYSGIPVSLATGQSSDHPANGWAHVGLRLVGWLCLEAKLSLQRQGLSWSVGGRISALVALEFPILCSELYWMWWVEQAVRYHYN